MAVIYQLILWRLRVPPGALGSADHMDPTLALELREKPPHLADSEVWEDLPQLGQATPFCGVIRDVLQQKLLIRLAIEATAPRVLTPQPPRADAIHCMRFASACCTGPTNRSPSLSAVRISGSSARGQIEDGVYIAHQPRVPLPPQDLP